MTVDHRAQLLQNIKGQQAHLPDLRPIFAGWPGAYDENINPHWKMMTVNVDDKLERWAQPTLSFRRWILECVTDTRAVSSS